MPAMCLFRRCVIFIALASVLGVSPLLAEATRAEFDTRMSATTAKLNAEAAAPEGGDIVGEIIRREYDAPAEEMQWALNRGLTWGSIAALAYIRATTGESFAALDSVAVEKDLWAYAGNKGMNADKMALSLGRLLKRVEEERNTRILERVRGSRRVSRIPDLGSGFGLLQETLDFRRLETPKPTKVHTVP
jgi:hypothetical protein